MRCAIYVRVSTDEQAKHGYSILAQIEKLEAYCLSQGWETVGEPYIDDGYSAKDLNRPRFKRMIETVKNGDIDVVLVYRLDRLTRSVLDLYEILKILDENNCKFKSATEVYDTTSAMGRLFITLVAAIAQWERENLAERVKLGIEKKVKLGKWKGGTPPYGYFYKDDLLQINPDEATIVKKVFDLSKEMGFTKLASKLTEMGYKTRSSENWHVDTVRGIANNPVYAGYITNHSDRYGHKKPPREQTLYDGNHEKIISKEEFWTLQDVLDKRRTPGAKRETSNYYFSQILKCGRCGHSISGHKANGKKGYRCSGKKAGKSCTSHMILEENLVKTVFAQFDQLIGNITSNEPTDSIPTERLNNLKSELASVEKLMQKKKTMYEADIISIDELITSTDDLRTQQKELQSELDNIQQNQKFNNDVYRSIVDNIDELWLEANDNERKQIISTLFSQIVIDTKDEYKRSKMLFREIIIVSAK
ncbi:recombinase family protein [Lysinibacillus sphaericus]|uniref:recombinase family protein n=1 Tax=Lysinibacillus sphaericus TaxID=1421 RepID=UPI00068936ED|nr:recombinase family protein [Lysinibacillus sphaericus]